MNLRSRWGLCALSAVIFFAGKSHAEPLGASARHLPARSLKLNVYYRGVQDQNLNFAVGSSGVCISSPNSPVTFPCGATGNTPAEGSGQAAVLRVTYQPYDNLQYYASFGAGKYALNIASITTTSTLTGDLPGFLWGAGIRGLLFPESIVTPALAIDGSVGWERYSFNRNSSGVTAAQVNVKDRLDLMRLQLALEVSRRFKVEERLTLEPYGGVKFVRSQAWLKDLNSGDRFGGIEDSVTPFAGLNIPLGDNESLWGEAAFVGGYEYAAGLAVRF